MKVRLEIDVKLSSQGEQAECEAQIAQQLRHLADEVENGHPCPCETYHPLACYEDNRAIVKQVHR